ncbi:hypothetical protein [Winogradskyella sp. SYSU M77433]|uniref:hypothetical protein n=1 Tax=Winogradskyella sp. SYSU M77433 TaxID=3042722 RepID=UPI002480EF21|nr:hypothetical protein [Winogradskyella sp. SYSU M77433]MDH7912136.1 hypothetical protein [Winogradskyella sp. SYSU M77433]
MKNRFLLAILVLGLLFINQSCQKDERSYNEVITSVKQPPKLTAKLYFGDSIIKSNQKLNKHVRKFVSQSKDNSSTASSSYGFSIDTTIIQVIATNSYTSYTFIVDRGTENDALLENYVITYFNNGESRQYLISYPIIIGTISTFDIENATIEMLTGEGLFVPKTENCTSIVAYQGEVCENSPCKSGEHTLDDGAECDYWGTIDMATQSCTPGGFVEISNCASGGGDGSTPGTGNTGGGSSGDNNDTDPVEEDEVVVPLEYTAVEEIENCINGLTLVGVTDSTTIDPDILDQISLLKGEWVALNNYLQENNCSEEAQQNVINELLSQYEAICLANGNSSETCACVISGNTVEICECILRGGEESKCINISESIDKDISILGTCVEDILNDLVLNDFSSSNPFNNTSLIEEVFDEITGNNSSISVTYKIENISGNGSTSAPVLNTTTGKYEMTIKIDTDIVNNGTKIAITKTILHETIHAYLRYLQKTNPSDFSDPNGDFSDLVTAWQSYRNLGYAHHVYMATLISQIGQQLSVYAIDSLGYPSNNNSYMNSDMYGYYEAIAWSGIAVITNPSNPQQQINNPLFTANYSNLVEQQLIISIFTAENTGQSHNGILPLVGDNCN